MSFEERREQAPLEVQSNFTDKESVKRPAKSLILVTGTVIILGLVASFYVGRGTCVAGNARYAEDPNSPEGSLFGSFSMTHDFRGRSRYVKSKKAVVASDHGRCAEQGAQVMEDGGNAVDAAVVTALCQGIYNPMASGIGGGHIMVVKHWNGSSVAINARETAPEKATKNMFKGHPKESLLGGKAIAVPLELKGLYMAHSMYGIKPWKELLQPSVNLAENGFEAHPYFVSSLQSVDFSASKELRETFYVYDKDLKDYRPPKVNETCCKRPMLAEVLRAVAEDGPSALYSSEGKFASSLIKDVQNKGGIITINDLEGAEAILSDALTAHAFGMQFILPPPPSSAASILLALRILEGYQRPLAGSLSLGHHRIIESMKHAFAVRMSLGDDAGNKKQRATNQEILGDAFSVDFADRLRSVIQDDTVLNTTSYGDKWNPMKGGMPPEDHGTSHMSIVDEKGMAVSLTSTINTSFGSKVLSPSTGILLNNQMDDFSSPSQSNVYGIPPSESNFIAPGKRPMSSMSPMIVTDRQNRLKMVVGASGGPRIISAVLQTILRVLSYGQDLFSAVSEARWHHQLLPDSLQAEQWADASETMRFEFPETLLRALQEKGHNIIQTDWGAVVQAITVDDFGLLTAASDPRKDGAPSGV
jgi:gamma-glutamyltranspeptidase / glutathione hydrolase / leukotriene-C4 hydrolase